PAPSFAIPPGVGGRDEIGAVARALDEASARVREHVDRLEARDRALTSYVDATTHDLAIPLTVLQSRLAELDARLREAAPLEPGALGPALAECEYLGQLVSNMAAAARLGSGQPVIERHRVELGALIERVVERHRPLARNQGVVLDHAVPSAPLLVDGDDILLERAISNLVHNAIRHGARKRRAQGEEGHVAVVLEPLAGTPRFRITIADDGPDADLERVASGLEALPADDSRNARARGLGLRIVRAVIDAHGIDIALARTEEGGLEVKLEGSAIAE
nr:ATP-binding protein [Myxococcota bacterium]